MDMLWNGWGDPARATSLPDTVTGLLRELLGVKPRDAAPLPLAEIDVPASPWTRPPAGPSRRRSAAVRTTCAPTRRPACGTPAASPPPTCC